MAENDAVTDTIKSINKTLEAAHAKLRQAEQVASTVPQLRREIKVLEKARDSLSAQPTQRRKTGPTIKDSIFEALEAAGGRIEFEPGEMLKTIHALTGGKETSVQVEIHRLRRAGRIVAERNADSKPIALALARPTLAAVPTTPEAERLEG